VTLSEITYTQEDAVIEKEIKAYMDNHRVASFAEIIGALSKHDSFTVKENIWNLISHGYIAIDNDYDLIKGQI